MVAAEVSSGVFVTKRLARVAQAIGYTELSRLSGIDRTTLYKMLAETGNPTISNVYDLFRALGVHIQLESDESSLAEVSGQHFVPTGSRGSYVAIAVFHPEQIRSFGEGLVVESQAEAEIFVHRELQFDDPPIACVSQQNVLSRPFTTQELALAA